MFDNNQLAWFDEYLRSNPSGLGEVYDFYSRVNVCFYQNIIQETFQLGNEDSIKRRFDTILWFPRKLIDPQNPIRWELLKYLNVTGKYMFSEPLFKELEKKMVDNLLKTNPIDFFNSLKAINERYAIEMEETREFPPFKLTDSEKQKAIELVKEDKLYEALEFMGFFQYASEEDVGSFKRDIEINKTEIKTSLLNDLNKDFSNKNVKKAFLKEVEPIDDYLLIARLANNIELAIPEIAIVTGIESSDLMECFNGIPSTAIPGLNISALFDKQKELSGVRNRSSDIVDMIRMTYLPYVDLFFCDKAAYESIRQVLVKYKIDTKIIRESIHIEDIEKMEEIIYEIEGGKNVYRNI